MIIEWIKAAGTSGGADFSSSQADAPGAEPAAGQTAAAAPGAQGWPQPSPGPETSFTLLLGYTVQAGARQQDTRREAAFPSLPSGAIIVGTEQ